MSTPENWAHKKGEADNIFDLFTSKNDMYNKLSENGNRYII